MKSFSWRLLLAALLVSAWSGCASFTSSPAISMNLVTVRSVTADVLESTVVLVVRVTNESPEPLQLKGSSHRLDLNGTHVGSGVTNGTITVPPLASTTIPVTIHLENLTLLRKFGRADRLTEVSYRLESRLFPQQGGFALKVATDGALDLRPFLGEMRLEP